MYHRLRTLKIRLCRLNTRIVSPRRLKLGNRVVLLLYRMMYCLRYFIVRYLRPKRILDALLRRLSFLLIRLRRLRRLLLFRLLRCRSRLLFCRLRRIL